MVATIKYYGFIHMKTNPKKRKGNQKVTDKEDNEKPDTQNNKWAETKENFAALQKKTLYSFFHVSVCYCIIIDLSCPGPPRGVTELQTATESHAHGQAEGKTSQTPSTKHSINMH